jgi:hypothetical protein
MKARIMFGIAVTVSVWACSGEGFFGPKGGVSFPRATWQLDIEECVTYDMGMQWGALGEAGIGFGGTFDIMWQRNAHPTAFDTVSDSYAGVIRRYDVDREVRRTGFPLTLFLIADPLSAFMVRPVFRGGFGPTMLIYTHRQYSNGGDDYEFTEHSGVYWGTIGEVSVEVDVTLGESTVVYAGLAYHWSRVSKRQWGTLTRYEQDMSGPVVQLGLRFF